jgi:hypothetical protein
MGGNGDADGTWMKIADPENGNRYEELSRVFLARYEGAFILSQGSGAGLREYYQIPAFSKLDRFASKIRRLRRDISSCGGPAKASCGSRTVLGDRRTGKRYCQKMFSLFSSACLSSY